MFAVDEYPGKFIGLIELRCRAQTWAGRTSQAASREGWSSRTRVVPVGREVVQFMLCCTNQRWTA